MNAKTETESDAGAVGDAHVLETLENCPQPIVKSREEHTISRRDIDPDALKVLYRLARNNYIAYLVGGGVRDLLLGRKPKDFDISTNAKPEQIRALFRNCILIGRRFRLAHIRYGEKIIETSTFRSTPKQQADPTDPDADLFQKDDNLFGSPAEDALRRDFTVNGLFYDIESFSIIDYVGGMEDLAARRIRAIGDPCIRFREDPVRMVRAVRFASRLGFTLDPDTEDAIHQYGPELDKASPPRLLEEITRLFAFSSGEKAVRLLRSTGLLKVILPEVNACLDSDAVDHDLFWKRLEALDCGDTVLPDATPALIFAVLLMDPIKAHLDRTWTFDTTPRLRFDKLHAYLEPLALRLRFPRKLVDKIIHMYLNQNRFCNNASNRGKRGSLANFVTQDAFHESLALAEIILASEGGQQIRLNQWRDMLQDRIYGRDDTGGTHNGSHHEHRDRRSGGNHHAASSGNGGNSRSADAGAPAILPAGDGETPELSESRQGEVGGRKLSRSARRRRNKRMRRMQNQNETPQEGSSGQEGATQAGDDSGRPGTPVEARPESDTGAAPEAPAAVQEESSARSGRGRSRRGRGKAAEGKPETPTAEAAAGSEAEPPKKPAGRRRSKAREEREEPAAVEESGPPPKPLTAAAFWSEPVPEPEPEPAPEPEKKRRGRKPKAEAEAAPAPAKPKASRSRKSAEKKAEEKPEPSKPKMDRADEADIPMHWLDEI